MRTQTKINHNSNKPLIRAILSISLLLSISLVSAAKASDITAGNVLKLVNKARQDAGAADLVVSPMLQRAAQAKVDDMISNNYFAHTSPQGKTPWDFIEGAGYNYRFAGENLAISYASTEDEQKAWMDSPLHRKNILNADYKEIGIAVETGLIDGHKSIVTVQEFGTQMVVSSAPIASIKKEIVFPSKNNAAPIVPAALATPNIIKVTTTIPRQNIADLSQTVAGQVKLGEVIKNNKLTLAGWLLLFVFGIMLTAFDIIVLIYRKHKNTMVWSSEENSHF